MTNFAKIRDLARQEERLRWAVKRQEAKCTKITPTYSNAPRGGSGERRREEGMIRLLTVKEQHNAVMAALEDERDNLGRYTKRLKDGTWRAAMEYRYGEMETRHAGYTSLELVQWEGGKRYHIALEQQGQE